MNFNHNSQEISKEHNRSEVSTKTITSSSFMTNQVFLESALIITLRRKEKLAMIFTLTKNKGKRCH